MKIDLSQFRETFLEESAEHIATIESGLLQLKSSGADDETLNSVFRAAHSIKGGAGAFGLVNVVNFTHVLENLFDRMREHRVAISAELIALLLRANDVLRDLIAAKDDSLPPNTEEVRFELENASSESSGSEPTAVKSESQRQKAIGETEYSIKFPPAGGSVWHWVPIRYCYFGTWQLSVG